MSALISVGKPGANHQSICAILYAGPNQDGMDARLLTSQRRTEKIRIEKMRILLVGARTVTRMLS